MSILDPKPPTRAELSATYASYTNLAKNPDLLIAGNITRDPSSGAITTADVTWPDGTAGTFTVTATDTSGAVNAYTITYGSPATRTYTQPAITRDSSGAATNVPAITVS